eukprot:4598801-Prorocentrum_lima.AAC.1
MPMPLASGLLWVGQPRMMARTARWQMRVWRAVVTHGGSPQPWKTALIPVSYTHLTLPTICSV